MQSLVPILIRRENGHAVAHDRLADIVAQLVNLLAQREFLAQQKSTLIKTLRRVHPRIGCLSLRSVKGKAH